MVCNTEPIKKTLQGSFKQPVKPDCVMLGLTIKGKLVGPFRPRSRVHESHLSISNQEKWKAKCRLKFWSLLESRWRPD